MPEHFDAFVSYNSKYKHQVQELVLRLQRRGIKVWVDYEQLPPGSEWITKLQDGIAESSSCIALIGDDGLSNWQNAEVANAVRRRITEGGQAFGVFPVLLPGATVERMDGFMRNYQAIAFIDLMEDDSTFKRLKDQIPKPSVEGEPSITPYRGLKYFDVDHSPLFFGRENEREKALKHIENAFTPPNYLNQRFLALIGSSGSGKSSLARAGIIASIQNQQRRFVKPFKVLICRPTNNPIANLHRELMRRLGDQTVKLELEDFQEQMLADPTTLSRTVLDLLKDAAGQTRVLIFVDQFEEMFATDNKAALKAVISNLTVAATEDGGCCFILIAVRVDELGYCLGFPELKVLLQTCNLFVGPMSEEELRSAIVEPARMARVKIEDGLTELLLADSRDQPASLPQLQQVLWELHSLKEGMTVAAYKALGGIDGVLEHRADSIYNKLSKSDQQICQTVFVTLVHRLGEKYAKRRVPLKALFAQRYDEDRVRFVIKELERPESRLLVVEGDEADKQEVEVAHEALIRGWGQLAAWLKKDQEFVLWHERLHAAKEAWEHSNRHKIQLLPAPQLTEAQKWQQARDADLTPDESLFIRKSLAYWKKQKRIDSLLIAGSILALLLGAGFLLVWSRSVSRQLAATATMRMVPGNEREALTLAIRAARWWPTTREAEEALQEAVQLVQRAAIQSDGSPILTMAFSRDAQLLAIGSKNGVARIWETDTSNQRAQSNETGSGILSVAFSPDSNRLALTGEDGVLRLWDWRQTQEPAKLSATDNVLTKVAFARGDSWIVASSRDGTVRGWDLATRASQPAASLSAGAEILAMSVSPDGRSIVTGDINGRLREWDAIAFALQGDFDRRDASVITDVSFSNDGMRLASSSLGGYCEVWKVADRKRELLLDADRPAGVAAAAFSPDGEQIATAGLSGIVRLWSLRTGADVLALRGRIRQAQLSTIAFPPMPHPGGHKHVAIGGQDGAVYIYELSFNLLKKEAQELLARAK